MQQLHGTQAQWDAVPKPALAVGQVATTIDTARVYVGTAVGDVLLNPDTGLSARPGVCRILVTATGTLRVNGSSAGIAYQVNGGAAQFTAGDQINVDATGIVDIWRSDSVGGETGDITILTVDAGSSLRLSRLDCSQISTLQGFSVPRSDELRQVFIKPGLALTQDSYHHLYGISVYECNLGALALNRFFADLGPTPNTVTLHIGGNPGSATCDPTIATAKGYVVSGV